MNPLHRPGDGVTVTYTINATDAAGKTGANRTLTFTARN